MKTFKVSVNVWMVTGHSFRDTYYMHVKPSCNDIETLMDTTSRKRGFKGLDDIESFEASVREI